MTPSATRARWGNYRSAGRSASADGTAPFALMAEFSCACSKPLYRTSHMAVPTPSWRAIPPIAELLAMPVQPVANIRPVFRKHPPTYVRGQRYGAVLYHVCGALVV